MMLACKPILNSVVFWLYCVNHASGAGQKRALVFELTELHLEEGHLRLCQGHSKCFEAWSKAKQVFGPIRVQNALLLP
ncbi:hypothetical protein Ancab_013576 [Ancistrocladus abbreviatus]